ncbi:MAG: hypothetical protein ABIH20_00725 [Candidatus Diapherotrites archaeon]
MYQQTSLQQKRTVKNSSKNAELEEFKKIHSETFIYFLEQYEKWKELKKES